MCVDGGDGVYSFVVDVRGVRLELLCSTTKSAKGSEYRELVSHSLRSRRYKCVTAACCAFSHKSRAFRVFGLERSIRGRWYYSSRPIQCLQTMHASVCWCFGGFPVLEYMFILELVDLNLKRPTTSDHVNTVLTLAPSPR